MTELTYSISGAGLALNELKRIDDVFDNALPLYEAIGASLLASFQNNFEKEQEPDGNPWPQSVRAQVTGGKTLSDSLYLRNSMTFEANSNSVAVGSNVIYAAIHQFGGTIKAKSKRGLRFRSGDNGDWVNRKEVTIPRRSFLGLEKEDKKEISNIVEQYLTALMDRS